MGIRTLHRRVSQRARTRARARFRAAVVPAVAAGVSAVRIPAGPADALRRAVARGRHRLTRRAPAGAGVVPDDAHRAVPRHRAERDPGRLALARAWLSRLRPLCAVRDLVAAVAASAAPSRTLTARRRPRPDAGPPGPAATP